MIAAMLDVHTLTLTDIVIVAGILGYIVVRGTEALGWSRSSGALRRENEDLLRRNTDLEQTVERHEREIVRLSALVDDLQKRDQAAVLEQLRAHEANAEKRHARSVAVLTEIRDRLPKETP